MGGFAWVVEAVVERPPASSLTNEMTTMNMLSVMPIIMLVTMTMVGGACAFSFNGSSGNMLMAPRAPLDARCVANTAGDSKWCPQSSSRANSPHLSHSRQLGPPLFARRRRGSSADDEDDEYDDDYIDDLINEKFDDDFDDDDFIIDAEVEESSIAGADKDDDREYEYARVGRRRGRGADRYEGSDGSRGDGDSDGPSSSSSRREQRRRRSYAGDDVDQYDGYDAEFDEEDDDYEEDYDSDDDVDDDDDDDEDDFEEGILIPNPILDSVDPEGASERIGELFEDPKFLKDMAVVAFVVWVVYFLTFDATDLIPWDIMKPEDFPLESLYEKR